MLNHLIENNFSSINEFNVSFLYGTKKNHSNIFFLFVANTIANSIERFNPCSDAGKAIKQRIYEKKLLSKSFTTLK